MGHNQNSAVTLEDFDPERDSPLFREWLERPRVARWFGEILSELEAHLELSPDFTALIMADGVPVGFAVLATAVPGRARGRGAGRPRRHRHPHHRGRCIGPGNRPGSARPSSRTSGGGPRSAVCRSRAPGLQRTHGQGGQEGRLLTVARVHRSGPGTVPVHARGSARCRPVRAAAEQRVRQIPLTRARRYIASVPQRESAASRDSGLSARVRRGLSGHVPAACP